MSTSIHGSRTAATTLPMSQKIHDSKEAQPSVGLGFAITTKTTHAARLKIIVVKSTAPISMPNVGRTTRVVSVKGSVVSVSALLKDSYSQDITNKELKQDDKLGLNAITSLVLLPSSTVCAQWKIQARVLRCVLHRR